ncbi:MAG: glutamate--cysteine ligase [Actinomycetales bacterium]|nr:glutamate--cysteine ligase [Actinomycetales bacterium]
MTPLPFADSERSTLGVEWELGFVDADSGDLRQVGDTVLAAVSDAYGGEHPFIHPELLLNTVEIVSGVRRTAGEAAGDLERSIAAIREVTDPLRVELMGGGAHPSAQWTQQKVTDKQRYATLIERTQWWGRQMLIYGVHVHVGIESRDKVLPIWRAMLTMFGHIQSLSASSPYWAGHDTGYASNRALMFQQLPTAGLGWQFEEWSQLERYVEDMVHTGVIEQFNEVRWDIRPSPGLGTLEMRIADGAANLLEVRAISAFTHCLVEHFSSMIDAGQAPPTLPAWFVQENKWRSARYGMDAILILDRERDERLVTESVEEWLGVLAPVAERLGCTEDLELVRVILRRGASYQRQRAAARQAGGDLGAVVDSLVAEMRAGKPL